METPSHLLPKRLQREQQAIVRWIVRAPYGTLPEHLLDPAYWVHVGGQLAPANRDHKGKGDIIRVIAEDGSFDIELTVAQVDFRGLWVQVRPLRVWPLELWRNLIEAPAAEPPEAAEAPDSDGYKIELSGPHGWRIIDAAGNVVDKELPDRAAAKAELAEIKAEKLRPPQPQAA